MLNESLLTGILSSARQNEPPNFGGFRFGRQGFTGIKELAVDGLAYPEGIVNATVDILTCISFLCKLCCGYV